MKKYYFTIASILVLVIGIASCSNEENKTQNNTASRPTVPVMANEVQIGNQIWMTKNLNVSRYRNGDPIPQVTNATQWANLTTGAWCYYNNNPANGPIYGKLYNWYAVNDPRGLAPSGWHVPSYNEWLDLIDFLDGETVAGGKMKSTTLWMSPNANATNSSGFTGLPAGNRDPLGQYLYISRFADWWTSTATDFETISAWDNYLYYQDGEIRTRYYSKNYGYSVRCIKD